MSTKTINRVLDKLKRTTKLSAVKTELSAVDDIEQALEKLINLTMGAGGPGQRDLEDFSQLENSYKDFKQVLQDVKDVATEFTIAYENFDELVGEVNDAIAELEPAMERYEDLANELGIEPLQNETYARAVTQIQESEDSTNELTNFLVMIAGEGTTEDAFNIINR